MVIISVRLFLQTRLVLVAKTIIPLNALVLFFLYKAEVHFVIVFWLQIAFSLLASFIIEVLFFNRNKNVSFIDNP